MNKYFFLILFCLGALLTFSQNSAGINFTSFARIKKDTVIFKRSPPPIGIRDSLILRLKNGKRGYYELNYSVSEKGDMILSLDKKRADTAAMKVLKTTGALLFLALGAMAIFR